MNWIDEHYQRERYADLLRGIQHEQMIRVLLAGKRHSLYQALLAGTGRLLVRLGIHLQRRSGTFTDVTISVPTGKVTSRHRFYN